MQSPEIQMLLQQYLAGSITKDDFIRLWQTLDQPDHQEDWLTAIENAIDASPSGFSATNHSEQALEGVKARIYEEQYPPSRIHKLYHSNKRFIRYAAAIVVIISATVLTKYSRRDNGFKAEAISSAHTVQDAEPGGEKAILTLSDGSTIVLDNANSGQIAQQGHTRVIKLANGEIQYKSANSNRKDTTVVFNTMSTPRGGQYQLLLPDGSKVWLNSESSITYPVVFAEKERKVKISGEAYFEVAKDKTKPFRVETGDMQVEVLGTHFNVRAYADDGPTKTSLLEGSVKIDKQILKPGEAFMNGRVVPTNVDQDVAWKNGIFNFNNQNLSQVMKQLARWYDLDVDYADGIPQKEYGGEIGKNLKLSQVLKGLENSGVHFELNGKRVTVNVKHK